MKKIYKLLPILAIVLNSVNFSNADEINEASTLKKFVVTAYYSPLPDQQFYLRGNYEDEKRLNGEGKRGASGNEVHPGMLAAPKTYAFGTKIFFDGLGIGTVEDRGGAIVGSGSRGYDADRIDIWMGYGDNGLKRALTWGKRTVYGRIVGADESLDSISLEDFKIGRIDFESLKNASYVGKYESKKTDSSVTVPVNISSKATGKDILLGQQILNKLGYYNGNIDGIYSKSITSALIKFQMDQKVITKTGDLGAGFYGPKTRQAFISRYQEVLSIETKQKEQERTKQKELAQIDNKVKKIVSSFGTPKDSEVGSHVRKLQKTLKLLGYFKTKDTAIFGKQTKDSIMHYQIDKGLIRTSDDLGAGMIGEKTLSKIKDDLSLLAKNDKTLFEYLDI